MRYVNNKLSTVPGTAEVQGMFSIGHSPDKCTDLAGFLMFSPVLLHVQQGVLGQMTKPGKRQSEFRTYEDTKCAVPESGIHESCVLSLHIMQKFLYIEHSHHSTILHGMPGSSIWLYTVLVVFICFACSKIRSCLNAISWHLYFFYNLYLQYLI